MKDKYRHDRSYNRKCTVCGVTLFGANQAFCSREHRKYKRRFRVWDGEGKTLPDGRHLYTLLACYDWSGYSYIENDNGLSSEECLAFLTQKRCAAYNVWFSFGYDVNKILEGLPLIQATHSRSELWKNGLTHWKGYRLQYTARKFFTVSKKQRSTFHSYDTFGFFQTSFLKTLEDWHFDSIREIQRGKEERDRFALWTADAVREYNHKELELFFELVCKLRDILFRCDMLPQSWHGAGAVANIWLQNHHVQDFLVPVPSDMFEPTLRAYFGGRIDISTLGEIHGFKYDIASAYPAGICDLPSLTSLSWEFRDRAEESSPYALYHVRWEGSKQSQWNPLPYRTERGLILYPFEGEGWYWGLELLAAECAFPNCIERIAAFYPVGPLTFPLREAIQKDFALRQEYKDVGDMAHIALKLALNSIYGKLASRHGWKGKTRWNNYIWAGMITAHCRAQVSLVMAEIGQQNVVAVATDGLFIRKPIAAFPKPAPLGKWEDEGECDALFVSPGLYATFHDDKPDVYKARGLPASINYGFVLRHWGCITDLNTPGRDSVASLHSSFIGMGRAIHQKMPCGVFQEDERRVKDATVFGTTKRLPLPQYLGATGWKEYPLYPKRRRDKNISYPFRYHPELDLKLDQE